MSTKCQSCPLRAHAVFDAMSPDEVAFMQGFKSGEMKVDAGTTLMMEGSNSPQLYTVLKGMGLRYKILPSGDRQVISFVFPGDFIGLQAAVMQEMQHSVESSTPMTLCVFDRRSLWELFKDHPGRAYDVTWAAAMEEHFLGESLAALGRMSGQKRIARAFARINMRAETLDMTEDGGIPFPFKQQDLADALGLSLVHTNKTLSRLRQENVADWQNRTLRILDNARLYEMAELDPDEPPMPRPLI